MTATKSKTDSTPCKAVKASIDAEVAAIADGIDLAGGEILVSRATAMHAQQNSTKHKSRKTANAVSTTTKKTVVGLRDLVYFKVWMPPAGTPVRANVLFFHGLGEHILRYEHVFSAFTKAGFVVKAMDARGHGRTHAINIANKRPSLKGYIGSFKTIWEDMLMLHHMKVKLPKTSSEKGGSGSPQLSELVDVSGLPTFVYGQSLGGLIALGFAYYCGSQIGDSRGVIASSPAFGPTTPIPPAIAVAARVAGTNILETYSDNNKIDISGLSTDASVVSACLADPFVHDRITLRTVRDIVVYAQRLVAAARADKFSVPVLLAHSVADRITSHAKTKAFVDALPTDADKLFIEYQEFGHELHNEPIKEELIDKYISWMESRLQ